MAQPEKSQYEAIKERTTRKVRHLGYVVFMGGGLLIFVPMIIAVFSGINNDRIWEPQTGQAVVRQGSQTDCTNEARRMLVDADELSRITSKWDASYREWLLRCRKNNPGLYDLVRQTRQELRARHKASKRAKK